MLYTTRQYIDTITAALSERSGVKIKEGDGWSVNVKTKTLMYKAADLLALAPDVVKGLLLHELGHVKYTEEHEETALEQAKPVMHDVYNALEDIRIETKLMEQYGDFAVKPLGISREAVINGYTQPETTADPIPPAKHLREVLTSTILRNLVACGHGDAAYMTFHTKHIHDQALATIRQLEKTSAFKDAIQAIKQANSTDDVKHIVDRDIYPLLKPIIDLIPPEQSMTMTQGLQGGLYDPTGLSGIGKDDKQPDNYAPLPDDTELSGMLAPYIHVLSGKLEQILKERKSARWHGQYLHGFLQSRNAYKILTHDTRVFSRHSVPDKTDYNLIFLLDSSGSMNGDHKVDNTYIGAFLLSEVAKVLRFTTHYAAFDTTTNRLPSLSDWRHFSISGGTDDLRALQYAQGILDPHRENIVFLMTDGETSDHGQSDLLRTLEKRGDTTVIAVAIGIRKHNLRAIYPHVVDVPTVSDLPRTMLDTLARCIHR